MNIYDLIVVRSIAQAAIAESQIEWCSGHNYLEGANDPYFLIETFDRDLESVEHTPERGRKRLRRNVNVRSERSRNCLVKLFLRYRRNDFRTHFQAHCVAKRHLSKHRRFYLNRDV